MADERSGVRPVKFPFFFITAAASMAVIGCISARGEEAPRWGSVSGWEIRVDTSLGHGCFASRSYEEGSLLRVGFDPSLRSGYLFFGAPSLGVLCPPRIPVVGPD